MILGRRSGNLASISGDFRSTKVLTLRTRVPQTGPDALGNQAALQLGHGAQNG